MVTSLAAEDGKTSIAANLAITLAELGQGDVLLIDADLRHPDLHDVFAIPPVPGLAGFLESAADVPVIVRSRHVPRLHVLPAGRASRNPADLLGSSRLSEMLGALRGRFAHIVFDTSPLFGVPDTLAVAACVDGVAVVLRQGRARREDAQRAFRLLESARAPILGVILNRDRSRDAAYYGYSAEV
jgi:capsular exopolysaccharide synthesis family protein